MDDADNTDGNTIELTAEIVTAYVSANTVPAGDLPKLISDVHGALMGASQGGAATEAEKLQPAVSIRSSVKPDVITCLECGKKQKSLKRHLGSAHDLTPDEYRQRWNLSKDYPMVAPDYSAARSALAKKLGLGRKAA